MTTTTKVVLGICESCDGIADANDDKCHGCDKVICAFCSEMFQHQKDRLHGVGSPTEALAYMRERFDVRSREAHAAAVEANNFLERAQASEAKYAALKKQAIAAQETIRAFCNYVAIAKPIEDGDGK
jgi:hypothetical protein